MSYTCRPENHLTIFTKIIVVYGNLDGALVFTVHPYNIKHWNLENNSL